MRRRHTSPRTQPAYIRFAAGAAMMTASDGTPRKFDAGSVLLMEDTWGKEHSTQLIGEVDALLFAVTLADSEPPSRGEPDVPIPNFGSSRIAVAGPAPSL